MWFCGVLLIMSMMRRWKALHVELERKRDWREVLAKWLRMRRRISSGREESVVIVVEGRAWKSLSGGNGARLRQFDANSLVII